MSKIPWNQLAHYNGRCFHEFYSSESKFLIFPHSEQHHHCAFCLFEHETRWNLKQTYRQEKKKIWHFYFSLAACHSYNHYLMNFASRKTYATSKINISDRLIIVMHITNCTLWSVLSKLCYFHEKKSLSSFSKTIPNCFQY